MTECLFCCEACPPSRRSAMPADVQMVLTGLGFFLVLSIFIWTRK